MSKKKYRFSLLVLAFVLLITGAILRYQELELAWWFIGIAVIIYIIARVFMREKRPRNSSSPSQ